MKALNNFFNSIYWFIYKLTPKGRKAWILKKGLEGIRVSNRKKTMAKLNVIDSANEVLKKKKIITFLKGKSVTKSKASDHQVIDAVSKKHDEELKENHIKINRKGKFQNA